MVSLEREDAGLVFIINVAEFQTFHVCLRYYATRMKCILHYISEKKKQKVKERTLQTVPKRKVPNTFRILVTNSAAVFNRIGCGFPFA